MIFDEVFKAFFPGEEQIASEPFGTGHIHETFLISLLKNKQQFILQKINQTIFSKVDLLQENIQNVTRHIRKEILENARYGSRQKSVEVFKTQDGKDFFLDNKNEYWRCFTFISKSRTYDQVNSPELAFQAGKALGAFIRLLNNFPAANLNITLPNFHNLDYRLQQFYESIEKNPMNRKAKIEREISFIQKKVKRFQELIELAHKQGIPLRVTHNDPKINNILFDESDLAICLIDLDTVMPGYIYHDFGDAIRTGAASAAEDEPDTSKMFVRIDLFEAYARGFLSETNHLLTNEETSIIPIAPQIMTFIIGLRFLTDFINGDIYFKTHHQNQNLERWFAQKALQESMEENEALMKKIINQLVI